MKRRKVLVIHESHTMRRILARSIEGELGDVDVSEAFTPGEGIEQLHDKKYNVVVCGNEMTDIDGIAVHTAMRSGQRNRNTPFLLMTASPSAGSLKHMQTHGIDHVLPMPVSGKELARQIDSVCDPRDARVHERQAVPDSGAVVHSPSGDIRVNTVNIGAGGVLGDFDYFDDFASVFAADSMTLYFPADYGLAPLTVTVQFLRMSVSEWETPTRPKLMRMAWRFVEISEGERAVLHTAVQHIALAIAESTQL